MLISKHFDQIAIALSAICIVHCLAVPLLIALVPVVTIAMGSDTHFHELLLWLIVPTSFAGFALGYRVHGKIRTVLLGLAGIIVITIVSLWGHGAWSVGLEATVSVAASLVLGTAHWLNFRDVRRLHHHG